MIQALPSANTGTTPILFNRRHVKPDDAEPNPQAQLLEEAVLALLKHHYPTYMKLPGAEIRFALARTYFRFLLERTQGNNSRSAQIAGVNRNTIKNWLRFLNINWRDFNPQFAHQPLPAPRVPALPPLPPQDAHRNHTPRAAAMAERPTVQRES